MDLVHQSLEESARRFPHKTAVVCGDTRSTFAELDEAANRLATVLVAEGITPGDRVAIYLDNSIEAVIAIFGVLKAGAAFTAVNPSPKPDKLESALADGGAARV